MVNQPCNGMRFEARNLGVVKQGELTQRPLTVFCGPNNTGKTWVMYSLYYCYKLIARHKENKEEKEKRSPSKTKSISVQKINSIINKNLVDVFNTNQDSLKDAQFFSSVLKRNLRTEFKTDAIPS